MTQLRKKMLEELQGRKNYVRNHSRPENKGLGAGMDHCCTGLS